MANARGRGEALAGLWDLENHSAAIAAARGGRIRRLSILSTRGGGGAAADPRGSARGECRHGTGQYSDGETGDGNRLFLSAHRQSAGGPHGQGSAHGQSGAPAGLETCRLSL